MGVYIHVYDRRGLVTSVPSINIHHTHSTIFSITSLSGVNLGNIHLTTHTHLDILNTPHHAIKHCHRQSKQTSKHRSKQTRHPGFPAERSPNTSVGMDSFIRLQSNPIQSMIRQLRHCITTYPNPNL